MKIGERFRRWFLGRPSPRVGIPTSASAIVAAVDSPNEPFGNSSSPDAASPSSLPDSGAEDDRAEPVLPASLQEGLRQINACAAETFMALGSALQSIVTQTREITERSKEAASLGTGEQSGPIHALEQVLTEAARMRELGQSSCGKLHRILSYLEQCRTPMDRLRKLPFLLSSVAMLSRIEGGRLESNTIDVSSMTADMGGTAEAIAHQVATVGVEAARLTRLIEERTKHLDEIEEQERARAVELIDQTHAVLASFQQRRDEASRAVHKIDQQYEQVRDAANKIVMSLQSEDIARQRIEHILEALDQTTLASADTLDSNQAAVLVLQRSQLLSTRDMVSTSLTSVRDGLCSLMSGMDALTAETSALASQAGEESHSFSTEITSKLATLCAVFNQYSASASSVLSTLDSVMLGLAQMTTAVNDVEVIQDEICIIALNAGIKTERLGNQGAAIGVLADELHGITWRSDGDTRAILESLHAIEPIVREMAEQKMAFSASHLMHRDQNDIHREATALIDAAVSDIQKLPQMLCLLSERAATLRRDLQSATAVAERAEIVIVTFDHAIQQLDLYLQTSGYDPDAALHHNTHITKLPKLYSMQSERHVHNTLFGADTPAAEPILQPHSAPEDLGSGVELF